MARRIVLLLCILTCVNVFAATELEPRVAAPTAGNVSDTAVAFAGGKYLTVWRQLSMPDTGIWGAFSDRDGKPAGSAFPIAASANALDLRLFADGEAFALFWNEGNKTTGMCRIDGSGTVSGKTTVDPHTVDAQAFVGGRVAALTTTGDTRDLLIFDAAGLLIRRAAAQASASAFPAVFAGRASFIMTGRSPQLTLSRYSLDGARLQTTPIGATQCGTTSAACWTVADLRESDSGTILLLLRDTQWQLATMTVAPDGTATALHSLGRTETELTSALLGRRGTDLWVLATAAASATAPGEARARLVDSLGLPTTDWVQVIQGLDAHEGVVAAEGVDTLFAATSPATAGRQIQTFAFRELKAVAGKVVSNTPSIQSDAAVASNGTAYLAAWNDATGARSPEVHWAVLNFDGQRTSAVMKGSGTLHPHTLVSDGFGYLMLVSSGGALLARRISRDGALLGDTRVVDSAAGWRDGADVIWTIGGYIAVWSSDGIVNSALVMPSGTLSAPHEVLRIHDVPSGWSGSYADPAVAWNGRETLLVVRRVEQFGLTYPPVTNTRLEAFRGSSDGQAFGAEAVVLMDDAPAARAAAASSGDEFLVAAQGRHFVVRSGGVVAVATGGSAAPTDVIWDGTSYVVGRASSAVERIGRNGIVTSRTFVGQRSSTLDVAVDSARQLVAVGASTDGAGPFRAFSYIPIDFAQLPGRRRVVAR